MAQQKDKVDLIWEKPQITFCAGGAGKREEAAKFTLQGDGFVNAGWVWRPETTKQLCTDFDPSFFFGVEK